MRGPGGARPRCGSPNRSRLAATDQASPASRYPRRCFGLDRSLRSPLSPLTATLPTSSTELELLWTFCDEAAAPSMAGPKQPRRVLLDAAKLSDEPSRKDSAARTTSALYPA